MSRSRVPRSKLIEEGEELLHTQIREDAQDGTVAFDWLGPFSIVEDSEDRWLMTDEEANRVTNEYEYERIQSAPHDEFELEWERKMRLQRERDGRKPRSILPTVPGVGSTT